MPIRNMSPSVVCDLAERYGIEVRWYDRSMDIPERVRGPERQGCDVRKRILHFSEDDGFSSIEHYLHELVHVICQTPWWSLKRAPEEVLIFQFERALARATLEDWAFERVVEWQDETGIVIAGVFPGDLCLGDLKPYTRRPFWRMGFTLCREVGLLDDQNRPTYRWPDWSRIAPYQKAIIGHFESQTKKPLPKITRG